MQQPTAKWDALGLPAPGSRLTREAYMALPETMTRMEYINGVVVYPYWDDETMSPTPRPEHQRSVGRLYRLLHDLIPDGEVILAPMDAHLGGAIVQPDVFWVSEDSACIQRETYFEGAPDLVVEVLSPSTARYDKGVEFDLYETSGVREYWVADSVNRLLEVYRLEDGQFARQGAFGPGDEFVSVLLDGKSIEVGAIFTTSPV